MKKSMMTLFALSALVSSNIYTSDPTGILNVGISNSPQNNIVVDKITTQTQAQASALVLDQNLSKTPIQSAPVRENQPASMPISVMPMPAYNQSAPVSGTVINSGPIAPTSTMRSMTMNASHDNVVASPVRMMPPRMPLSGQWQQDQGSDQLESQLRQLDSDSKQAFMKLHSEWQNLESDAQKAFQQLRSEWQAAESTDRSHHMNQMHDMMMHQSPQVVMDQQGNVIGQYKVLGQAQGYHYGAFYTNVNQAPVMVIQGSANQGTPVFLSVPGASKTIIGYIENPEFMSGQNTMPGSSSQMITLYQYTMPAQR